MREVGFDPDSPLVKSIADDELTFRGDPTSLDDWASRGSKNVTRQIIIMRTFIRDYKKDKNTKPPSYGDWNGEFLSNEELALVKPITDKKAEELVKQLLKK